MEKPIMRIMKHCDKTTNKMIIPKAIIQQWGNDYYLEVYKDYFKLIPIKKEK